MISILRFGSDTSTSYVTGSYKNGNNEKPKAGDLKPAGHCKDGITKAKIMSTLGRNA